MTNHSELIQITEGVVRRRAMGVDSKLIPDIINTFVGFQESLSPVVTMNKDNVNKLWMSLRANPKITKFLLDGAAELYFRSGLDDKAWDKVTLCLANSLSIQTGSYVVGARTGITASNCVVDATIIERVEGVDNINRLLVDNKWLVFVILMSYCPIVYAAKLDSNDYEEIQRASEAK